MTHLGKPAAIVLATLLVALTPLFANADVGGKSERSIADETFLSAVNAAMEGDSFETASHGGIVSSIAKLDFDSSEFKALVDAADLGDKKLTRGQIISLLARSASGREDSSVATAKKPSDKHSAAANSSSDDEESDNGKAKGKDKPRENKPGDNENAAASSRLNAPVATTTAVPTATTAVPTATTAVPTATTAVPTATTAVPTAVTATATVTPTPEVTPIATATEKPGNNGQGHGNGNQGQ